MPLWEKKGLVYVPDGSMPWAKHSALTPTPYRLTDDIIRVFAGFRDKKGVSRIGYVDVDATNPSRILGVSKEPVLDIGKAGCFDDNGVILGDVIRYEDKVLMYYVGFQLVANVKFLAFTGLAVSHDEARSFVRIGPSPVMDRSDEGLFFRAIHTVIYEDGILKCWYGVGSKWSRINETEYPQYTTGYIESQDYMLFPKNGNVCLQFVNDEYRIGRPRVQKTNEGFRMYYTKGTLSGSYLPGYAESADGKSWQRMDENVGISPSEHGWDSQSLSYTAPLAVNNKEYLFYNGNDMGKTGFGYAVRQI
jgi:hypothetical protein